MILDPARTVADLEELRALTGDDDGAQRVAWTDTWETARVFLREKLAGTGAEAIAIVERDPDIGLLFTDILMPGGINGFELATEIRRRRPGIAILMTSGFSGNFSSGACDNFDIIRKPFTQAELGTAFLRVLSSLEMRLPSGVARASA